ncbi:MAG: phage holin family protein [Pseudomonadales bacterium]
MTFKLPFSSFPPSTLSRPLYLRDRVGDNARMPGIFVRLLITALGLWLATLLVPGVAAESTTTLLWAAIWLGIVNALIRPLVILLTLPVTLLTLGGFLLVVNAGMLALVAWALDGFTVDGFFSALFGSIVVSLTSWLGSSFVGANGRYEVLIIRRDQRY